MIKITHSELADVVRRWLFRVKGWPIVITEMAGAGEEADAIAFNGGNSLLVEVKVSLEDFRRDTKKSFRQQQALGMGNYRYFCVPKGLLTVEAIPEKWGLLEWDGKRMWMSKAADSVESYKIRELSVLGSLVRRIARTKPNGVSVACYYLENANRATASIEMDFEPLEVPV